MRSARIIETSVLSSSSEVGLRSASTLASAISRGTQASLCTNVSKSERTMSSSVAIACRAGPAPYSAMSRSTPHAEAPDTCSRPAGWRKSGASVARHCPKPSDEQKGYT